MLIRELYDRSGAEHLGLARASFDLVLHEIARKYLPATATAEDAAALLRGLHIDELVLARACAAGSEKAWETFLTRFREKLYTAAYSIAKDEGNGRELADSLYAELYGTTTRDGQRLSKLASYTGRGSLEGWLRTVLAQEFVNRYRSQRRLVSLEEKQEQGVQFVAPVALSDPPGDKRLDDATDSAFAALSPEDRFVLANYFLDGRTLAEIARTLGVHESTISRKLERITGALRKRIREGLIARGMSRQQADEAMETDVRDLSVDVRAQLAQESPARAFSPRDERQGSELP